MRILLCLQFAYMTLFFLLEFLLFANHHSEQKYQSHHPISFSVSLRYRDPLFKQFRLSFSLRFQPKYRCITSWLSLISSIFSPIYLHPFLRWSQPVHPFFPQLSWSVYFFLLPTFLFFFASLKFTTKALGLLVRQQSSYTTRSTVCSLPEFRQTTL